MRTSEGLIQLAAVQIRLSLDDYWTEERFAERIERVMEQVARRLDPSLPALVAFPEDVGLMLVAQGMQASLKRIKPTVRGAIVRGIRSQLLRVVWHRRRTRLSWVPALFYARHERIARTYFSVFAGAARRYRVTLVAGSVVLPPYHLYDGEVLWRKGPIRNAVYNTAYTFGPDGSVLGAQYKVHLIELEEGGALHLNAGDVGDLRAVATPVGPVGVAICLDAFQDDVVRALREKGAKILVQPSANPQPWDAPQQLDWLSGAYRRTYEEAKFEYAVNPMLTGRLWDLEFYGQSSIIGSPAAWHAWAEAGSRGRGAAGYAAVGPKPGFLAVAHSDREEEILVVTVPRPVP